MHSIIIKCSACLFPTLLASIYWFSNVSILRAVEIFAFKIKIVLFLKAIKINIHVKKEKKIYVALMLTFKHSLTEAKEVFISFNFERHFLDEGLLQAEQWGC